MQKILTYTITILCAYGLTAPILNADVTTNSGGYSIIQNHKKNIPKRVKIADKPDITPQIIPAPENTWLLDSILAFITVLLLAFLLVKLPEYIKKNRVERLEKSQREKEERQEKLIQAFKQTSEINDRLASELNQGYLNHKRYVNLKEELQIQFDLIKKHKEQLILKYLIVFEFFEDASFSEKHNAEYIARCKDLHSQYFVDLDEKGFGLTDRQLEAVFCNEDATLVNAGAGTGKTKTIESKVLHLVKHCNIPLNKILVMTFSKRSQEDMLGRIVTSLEKAQIPHNKERLKDTITTFHSFGKKVLDRDVMDGADHNKENVLIGKGSRNLTVLDERQKMQTYEKVLRTIRTNPVIQKLLSDFVLYYSVPQVSVSKFDTLSDYYEYTKNSYQTLLGSGGYNISVKSHGEVLIANYLWLHNIKTEYEPSNHFYTEEVSGQKRPYKPDFYLPDHDVYIEYFGLDKNGKAAPYIATDEYQKRVDQKITAHTLSKNKFIDIRYADLQNGQEKFLAKFENELKRLGIDTTPKTPNDIIQLTEVSGTLVGITKIMTTFLSLFKESDISIAEMKSKIGGNFDVINSTRNRVFLELFEAFVNEYNKVLEEEGYMDYGDMIRKATSIIHGNNYDTQYDYILIDEFQDISKARASLIKALISKNTNCRLFCVGDDWQSIYQFAGSDSSIFLQFKKFFGFTKEITLDKTFRFNQGISDLSSGFVMMNTAQKTKRLISSDQGVSEKILIYQKDEGTYDYFFDILSNIIIDTPNKALIKVMLLTRYSQGKYDDGFFDMLAKYKTKDNSGDNESANRFIFTYSEQCIEVTHMTGHKSKGLEADYVIVDYVNQNEKYSFPSNFEDDPILQIITQDSNDVYPFAEERRLFYVSMTRGKNKSYIVYTKGKESLFLKDLMAVNKEYHDQILKVSTNTKDEISILKEEQMPGCPKCGGKLHKRSNQGHDFFGCANWPRCEYTENMHGFVVPSCPICKADMILRKNKANGNKFWGCSNYSNGCRGIVNATECR